MAVVKQTNRSYIIKNEHVEKHEQVPFGLKDSSVLCFKQVFEKEVKRKFVDDCGL